MTVDQNAFWFIKAGAWRDRVPYYSVEHKLLHRGVDLGGRGMLNWLGFKESRDQSNQLSLAKNIEGIGVMMLCETSLCVHEVLKQGLECQTTSKFVEVNFDFAYRLSFSVLQEDAVSFELFNNVTESDEVVARRLHSQFGCEWIGGKFYEIIAPRYDDIQNAYNKRDGCHVSVAGEEREDGYGAEVLPVCSNMIEEHGIISHRHLGWVCSDRVYKVLAPAVVPPYFWSWRYLLS